MSEIGKPGPLYDKSASCALPDFEYCPIVPHELAIGSLYENIETLEGEIEFNQTAEEPDPAKVQRLRNNIDMISDAIENLNKLQQQIDPCRKCPLQGLL